MYFESEKSPEAPSEAGAEAAVPTDEAPLAAAPEALRGALEKRGFEQLTAVQQSVAQADDGARDLRISSQTGSGKTVAIGFALAAKLVDPARVGVLGFSAGGHLASSVSVHHDAGDPDAADKVERASCRPDFAVLCYPVIAFGQPFTHKGSQRNLLGKDPEADMVAEMSSERHVDARTPPTFLWHTSADRAVPVENSLAYYAALRRAGVPCELHCFERGRHGVGLGKKLAASAWPKLCQRWLVARGVLRE